jgi:hypothetical protein
MTPAQAQHSPPIEPVSLDAKIRRLESITNQAFKLRKQRDHYRAHAERLAEALKEIVELNDNRGKGKPIARACNRMVDVAREALAQWEKGA